MKARATLLVPTLGFLGLFCSTLFSQTTPNSDGNYQQLRNIALQSNGISIENVTLKRDAASFLLNSGTLCFVAPVNNRVRGAVVVGDGQADT